jgi:hypothetical protein
MTALTQSGHGEFDHPYRQPNVTSPILHVLWLQNLGACLAAVERVYIGAAEANSRGAKVHAMVEVPRGLL